MCQKKIISIAVGIFLMFFNFLIPPFGGFDRLGISVLCIFAGTIILLVVVDLMWPVLLCLLAFAANGIYSLQEALQKSFGNQIFWFVAFVSIMLYTLRKTGVLWRISTALFRLKMIKTHPWLFLAIAFETILLLGCLLEPATLVMVFLEIFGSMFEQLHLKKGNRFSELVMMGVLIFAGMSYGVTPLAHPVAMVAVETFRPLYNVGLGEYTLTGLVIGTFAVAVYMFMLRFVFHLDIQFLCEFDQRELKTYGPMSPEEKAVSGVYLAVIVLWLAPALLSGIAPGLAEVLNSMGVIGPAMAGAAAMCIICIKGKPLAEMGTMLKQAVPWAACFPIAASMLLGSALTSEEVGMAAIAGRLLKPVLQSMPVPVFMLALAIFCSLFTDFTSNAISAMMTSTLCVVLIQSGSITGLHPGAMAVILGYCANLAYMYPSGSTYAAIISGSGWVQMGTQIKHGFVHSLIQAMIACTVGYAFACLIM